jgi:NAD(P)-dependent dehydrogenase (short-subunit alcohol dehydrogenase family)
MNRKVIVVTGASSGIGLQLAREVGARGARVVLAARRPDALAAAAGAIPGSLAVVTDVTRRAEVQRLLDQSVAHFGQVDVWVNNAGRGISKPALQLTDADFDEMMLVNVKSALYGMQAVVPHFQARGQGHLINVSSMLGRVPFASIRSAYSASKHALNSLTANVRADLQASHPGIRVSLVLPGVVATDFGLHALGGGGDSRSLPNAQDPGEVARAIAELIAAPQDELYTRPEFQAQVVGYFQGGRR